MGLNQGESSTQDNVVKDMVYVPKPDNLPGNESGPSTTAGYGAPTGQVSTGVEYQIRDVNTPNSMKPEQINTDASTENRSAKFKTGSQDVGDAGRNQYQ